MFLPKVGTLQAPSPQHDEQVTPRPKHHRDALLNIMDVLPKASDASDRSAFAAIDPITQKYHQLPEPGAYSLRGLASTLRPLAYFAISYVWDEWKTSNSALPSWELIRERLLKLSTTRVFSLTNTPTSPTSPRPPRHDPSTDKKILCWIDCKCIDQTSPTDKAFWVPRMNKVFFDAKRTILLLRGLDLTAVWKINSNTRCMLSTSDSSAGGRNTWTTRGTQNGNLKGSRVAGSTHRCILSSGCLSLRVPMDREIETLALNTLQTLWDSPWRKRAWIFQEILLSEQYILSWGEDNGAQIAYMSLEEIGRVVSWLHHRGPGIPWLTDFWTWCKQCLILQRFYAADCDMEATIFQLADNLEATIPCDKYYALCGILNLSDVTYSHKDSPDQALDKMIAALTAQGRMGWLYCIPPGAPEGIVFSSQHMAPFILTKKKKQTHHVTVKFRESFFSSSIFGITAVSVGKVNNEHSLSSVLTQLRVLMATIDQTPRSSTCQRNYLKDSFSTTASVHRRFHNFLFRLGYDMITPISEQILLDPLFRALDRSGLNTHLLESDPECCLWYTILSLCFITHSQVADIQSKEARKLVQASAQSIQHLCRKLSQQDWKILEWQRAHEKCDSVEPRLVAFNGRLPAIGTTVWAVHTKLSSSSILFVASELELSEQLLQRATPGINIPSMTTKVYQDTPFTTGQPSGHDPPYVRHPSTPGNAHSEYEDRAHCFIGIAYQIRTSALTDKLHQKYHDSDLEGDSRSKFWRLPGNVASQLHPPKPMFLTFQRRPFGLTQDYPEMSSRTGPFPTAPTLLPPITLSSETLMPPGLEAPSVLTSWNRPVAVAGPEYPMLKTEAVTMSTTDPQRPPAPAQSSISPYPVIVSAPDLARRSGSLYDSHESGMPDDKLLESYVAEKSIATGREEVDWNFHARAQRIPSEEDLLAMFPELRLSEVTMVLAKYRGYVHADAVPHLGLTVHLHFTGNLPTNELINLRHDAIINACFSLQAAVTQCQRLEILPGEEYLK